jgi:hypothetical protein
VAAGIREGNGCPRSVFGDDCNGVEHRLAEVDLHSRAPRLFRSRARLFAEVNVAIDQEVTRANAIIVAR